MFHRRCVARFFCSKGNNFLSNQHSNSLFKFYNTAAVLKPSSTKPIISYTQEQVDNVISKQHPERHAADPIDFDNYKSKTSSNQFTNKNEGKYFSTEFMEKFSHNDELCQTLSKDLKIDELLKVFHEHYNKGIYSAVSFGSVVSCLCKLGRVEEAIEYLELMQRNNMVASSWVHTHIAKAFVLRRDFDKALFYLVEFLQANIANPREIPSDDLYLVLITIYICQNWNFSRLMSILNKYSNFVLDESNANKLLVYFGDHALVSPDVLNILLQYLQKTNIPMSTLLCNSLLRSYCKNGLQEEAENLFEIMKHNTDNVNTMHPIYKGTLSAYGYNIMLHYYLKTEQFSKVNQILDYMKMNPKQSINDNSALNLILKTIGDNYETLKDLLIPVLEKYEPKDSTNVIMATASLVKIIATKPMSVEQKAKILNKWIPIFDKAKPASIRCGLLVSFAFLIRDILPNQIHLIHTFILPKMKLSTGVRIEDCSTILNMVRLESEEIFEKTRMEIYSILQYLNMKPNARMFETLITRSVDAKNKEQAQFYIDSFWSSKLDLNYSIARKMIEFEVLVNKNVDNAIEMISKTFRSQVFKGNEDLLAKTLQSMLDYLRGEVSSKPNSTIITIEQVAKLMQLIDGSNFNSKRLFINKLYAIDALLKAKK